MNADQLIQTWTANDLSEKTGAQAFIEDLCSLLQLEKPRSSADFCYEKGAVKDGGGQGWADVWKRDHFGWENKKPGRNLKQALAQLREYAGNLGNPPLLIVCDRERIEIHTAFRGYPDEPRTILLKDLGDLGNQQILRWVFTEPDKLKPLKSNAAITAEAAGQFAKLATALRERGLEPQIVAHFLTQCIFCMFAEDEGLLHASLTDDIHIFTNLLKAAHADPHKAIGRIKNLFTAMQKKGGQYGNDDIAWFNGGLFKTITIPELLPADLDTLYHAAADLDWRAIDPTIFGTLFERGLDPNCRAQLGAHYTDVETIKKLIDPLITRPLAAQWESIKIEISALLAKADQLKTAASKKQHRKTAQNLYHGYLEQLRNFRVLDAACGSGNFLYLALHTLKDLEHIAQLDAEMLGLGRQITIETGTNNILGLEINEYAAELARVTVWIGDIQWSQRNGRPINKNPILSNLDGIEHRDALLNADGTECEWPDADVIVGNPPFLGGSKKRGELGDAYFETLAKTYPKQRVPAGADLVCYWFDKARLQIESGKTKAAGLVSTNSIRGGANRTVLDNICQNLTIFDAWADEEWFDNGAAVRVSLVCFAHKYIASALSVTGNKSKKKPLLPQGEGWDDDCMDAGVRATQGAVAEGNKTKQFSLIYPLTPTLSLGEREQSDLDVLAEGSDMVSSNVAWINPSPHNPTMRLDGQSVVLIHADLTAGDGNEEMDLTTAKPIKENQGVSFQGSQKIGAFDIPGELARQWLGLPNPNGKANSLVIKPSWNGLDVTRRPRDGWIIDFGVTMAEQEASLFEMPFEFVMEHVKPERIKNNRKAYRTNWWRHGEPRIAMRNALVNLSRYLATSAVSKHMLFSWIPVCTIPDKALIVVARDDDTTFGILHSRFHELWSLGLCTWLGKGNDPRYTPTTCFETFPFPSGLSPADTAPKADSAETQTVPLDGFTTQAQVAAVSDSEAKTHALAIAKAAFTLNQLRENWLNPVEWVDWVITPEEETAGFPKRPVAIAGHEAELKKRTLTNLYNARPTWLNTAHQNLDKAVAAAYGWTDYTPEMPDAELLQRLLELNLLRSK